MTVAESHSGGLQVVLSTVSNQETATRIARQLVDERLVACANLLPGVTSIYRWKGELQVEGEVLMILKTGDATLDRLVERLQQLHPYEVPEVMCLPSASATAPYARWVDAETRRTAE